MIFSGDVLLGHGMKGKTQAIDESFHINDDNDINDVNDNDNDNNDSVDNNDISDDNDDIIIHFFRASFQIALKGHQNILSSETRRPRTKVSMINGSFSVLWSFF